MPDKISLPLTLRITAAEVLESQLAPGDVAALTPLPAEEGRCGGTYCERDYQSDTPTVPS